MTNRELVAVQKADAALADLAYGGLLNPEQANTFFRKVIEQPTIINEARTVGMNSPKREVNKVGFGSASCSRRRRRHTARAPRTRGTSQTSGRSRST